MFTPFQKQSQELVVNKPNILDRPKKVSSAGGGGGVSNNNTNAAPGGGGAAPVDIRKLTVRNAISMVYMGQITRVGINFWEILQGDTSERLTKVLGAPAADEPLL